LVKKRINWDYMELRSGAHAPDENHQEDERSRLREKTKGNQGATLEGVMTQNRRLVRPLQNKSRRQKRNGKNVGGFEGEKSNIARKKLLKKRFAQKGKKTLHRTEGLVCKKAVAP